MGVILSVSFFLFMTVFSARSQSISTIPDTDDSDAYLTSEEGDINVTVVCIVFSSQNQVITPWRIRRQSKDSMIMSLFFSSNGQPTSAEFMGDIIATGEFVPMDPSNRTYRTNVTFLNFTREFDTTQLQCGVTAVETRNVFLGFPVPPSVRGDVGIIFVTEGNEFAISLEMAGAKTPFPPAVTSVWTFNEKNLTHSSSIMLNDFNITLERISRNMTGNYTLIVSNSAGSISGSFEVDVQFPPEATPVEQPEIVLPNSSVILVAFLPVIGGNPVPNVSWTGPDGEPRNNIGRFDTSVPGQIVITDTREGDNGSYTCTLRNGISPDQSQDVELFFAVRAGPPRNLLERDITDTTVNLTWSSPGYLGIPELSFYQILVSPPPPSGVNTTTAKSSLLLHSLTPGTQYIITVVGVSTGENFDTLEGEKSNLISFKTATRAPSIDSVIAVPKNGTILIKWTLKHTGGLSVNIYSYCEVDELGADSRLVSLQLCDYDNCFNGALTGNTTIDNVQSGQVYSCSVTAVNTLGSDTIMVTNVFSNEGLPSTPILVSSTTLPGVLNLIFRAEFAGVLDGSFRFSIKILNESNGSIFRIDTYWFPYYKDNETVIVNINILEGGVFTLVVFAVNSFGFSLGYEKISGITVRKDSTGIDYSSVSLSSDFIQCTPTYLISDQMSCQCNSDRIITGITVAVFIILVIIGVVIITVIIAFKWKGAIKVRKKLKNKNLTVKPSTDYEIIEKPKDNSNDQLDTIGVKQNIAYGEVNYPVYL